jgi:hypothetical protein
MQKGIAARSICARSKVNEHRQFRGGHTRWVPGGVGLEGPNVAALGRGALPRVPRRLTIYPHRTFGHETGKVRQPLLHRHKLQELNERFPPPVDIGQVVSSPEEVEPARDRRPAWRGSEQDLEWPNYLGNGKSPTFATDIMLFLIWGAKAWLSIASALDWPAILWVVTRKPRHLENF